MSKRREFVKMFLYKNIETTFDNFSFGGFSNPFTLKECSTDDLDKIEKLIRKEGMIMIRQNGEKNSDRNQMVNKFGEVYCSSPEEFEFLPGDRKMIACIVKYVQQVFDEKGIKNGNTYFQQTDSSKKNAENVIVETSNDAKRTNYFLEQLFAAAKRNESRQKGGYRHDLKMRLFATYFRMIAGPLAYHTLHRNLPCSLPSLPSTNRYIRSGFQMIEGVPRFKELLVHLEERKLPLMVSISEDATRVVGKIQYDSKTNQLMGFTLPLNKSTGMPIPLYFKARNVHEILDHFSADIAISSLINVVMVQPLGDATPFCSLVFGSDNQYTAEDVSNRWKYIIRELGKLNIQTLIVSSDSDPRYNGAMKSLSKLGHRSNYIDFNWFCADATCDDETFYVQDSPHIGTKLRNFFLRTSYKKLKLPFGPNNSIDLKHLYYLLDHFTKDKHQLTASILNPVDKQNFQSVLRMCDEKVTCLLKSSVKNSDGTIWFLDTIRDVLDSFMCPNLTPLQRIQKLWYRIFCIRLWRRYVSSHKTYCVKDNFLTANCYACIELNGHSLIQIILHLHSIDRPDLFLPFLFNSQQCESIFRTLRSFTSTFSTVTNSSVKESCGRMSKIELQKEIIHMTSSQFAYPRHESKEVLKRAAKLPSFKEIIAQINQCKVLALKTALDFKIITKKDSKDSNIFTCEVNPYVSKKKTKKSSFLQNTDPITTTKQLQLSDLNSISLKNFPEKTDIDENSPFVELHFKNRTHRTTVKKTSLCWLLRKDWQKISNDRLRRVQCSNNIIKISTRSKTKLKRKKCLLYTFKRT